MCTRVNRMSHETTHSTHVLLVLCAESACARVLIECPTKQHTLHMCCLVSVLKQHMHTSTPVVLAQGTHCAVLTHEQGTRM